MNTAQWMAATIIPKGDVTLCIRNAKLAWGKFCKTHIEEPDTYIEMSAEEINQIVISTGDSVTISSCGLTDPLSGTEGSFDIYEGHRRIGSFYWDCLWGKKTNAYTWIPDVGADDFVTQITGFNLHLGPLGSGKLICAKIS